MNYGKWFLALPLLVAPLARGDDGCEAKLDALSQTLLRLQSGAGQVSTNLATYQATCCTLGRVPAPGCSCTTTAITAAGALSSPGSYSLSNDITGDINAGGVQARIDLNGHKVTGNVTVGEHGYVCNGAITGTLTLASYAHAEFLRIGVDGGARGRVLGSASSNVQLNNIIFEDASSEASVDGFASIALDYAVFKSGVDFTNTAQIVVRRSQSYGFFLDTDQTLEKMFLYDTSVQSGMTIACGASLSSFGCWNCSLQGVSVLTTGAAMPVITFHGSTVFLLDLASDGDSAFRSTVLIDECACYRIAFTKMNNVRCQNCTVHSDGAGVAVLERDCQQVTFDHVDASASGAGAFSIVGGSNILLKQCSGQTAGSTAFSLNQVTVPLLNVNFFECCARNSATGFSIGNSAITGSILRCTAENCTTGFSAAVGVKMIFAENVALSNGTNFTPAGAFNSSIDPTTAVSWRNIANV
jgi:hypothetical protein